MARVIIRLDIGDPIRMEIVAEDGKYTFDTHIELVELEPIPVIHVKKPEKLFRVQRREFVRVKINIPLECEPLEPNCREATECIHGHIVNLSGGGVRIITWCSPVTYNFDIGSELELKFKLPDGTEIQAKAVIIHLSRKETEKGECFGVSVKFTEIDHKKQDDIIKYVLECQYEMRRKGLL